MRSDVLMQWQKLQAIADDVWPRLDPSTRQHIARNLHSRRGDLESGANETLHGSYGQHTAKASFYKAVIAIHDGRLEAARGHESKPCSLQMADTLLAESYIVPIRPW